MDEKKRKGKYIFGGKGRGTSYIRFKQRCKMGLLCVTRQKEYSYY
jgi:hypothetical protein